MVRDATLLFAINRIRALSLREKIRLSSTVTTSAKFGNLSKEALESIIGRKTRIRVWEPGRWLDEGERDQKGLTAGDFKCTFYGEPEFPPLLREIHDPPFLLFYRGTLPDAEKPALAVVGTRRPSGCGRKASFGLALEAGKYGMPVVSGLARGIDCSAHQGSTAGGGASTGVLGCGIDMIYPSSSAGAAYKMISGGGCVLSEYGTGVQPMKYHFPERNRLISGLSRGVVVVEAPERSGALITADFALEQGRDLFVHSACLGGGGNGGCRRLRFDGAAAISTAADILKSWGVEPPHDSFRTHGRPVENRGASVGLLEREIKGELVTFAGEYFEK